MTAVLASACWPAARVTEAVEALAHQAGLAARRRGSTRAQPCAEWLREEALEHRLSAALAPLGVAIDTAEIAYDATVATLRHVGPALLRLDDGFVALLSTRRGRVRLVSPDLRIRHLPLQVLTDHLRAKLEEPLAADVDAALEGMRLPPRRRARARQCLLVDRLGGRSVGRSWPVRRAPGSPFASELRHAGIVRRIAALLCAHLAALALAVLAWWVLGECALSGRGDSGWLAAWALLLVTQVPARAIGIWLEADLSARLGAALKRRLLAGALRLDLDALGHEGAGRMLGRVLETVGLEDLVLSSGFSFVIGIIELALSLGLLGAGSAGTIHIALLVATLPVLLFIGDRAYHWQRVWTDARLTFGSHLIERMLGHRTRIVQERAEEWHEGEDNVVAATADSGRLVDRWCTRLRVLPRAFGVAAFAALAWAAKGQEPTSVAVALSVAGIFEATQALDRLVRSAADAGNAASAWERVSPLFHAAAAVLGPPAAMSVPSQPPAPDGAPVLEAESLFFTHRDRRAPILTGLSLRLHAGERALLEGPSGSGKSTLAALLAGLRRADAGLLVSRGLDLPTLGIDAWRRRVALVPQLRDNHVVTGTLAFNLLMGRCWPPGEGDLLEIRELLEELGLGPLIRSMPAGLFQIVGEVGWQLSHGERARIYLARALLQNAEVAVLDDTLGHLDPWSLESAVGCARSRVKTLLVLSPGCAED